MELTYAPTYVVWTFYFSIYIFFFPNGLKYSYYFIYHLYADSFQISVFSPAFSPEPQTQIPKFLPCEQKLNPVTMMSQESFYTGNVNMHNFGG